MREMNACLVAAWDVDTWQSSALPGEGLGDAENAGQDIQTDQVAPHTLRRPVPWIISIKPSDPGHPSSCLSGLPTRAVRAVAVPLRHASHITSEVIEAGGCCQLRMDEQVIVGLSLSLSRLRIGVRTCLAKEVHQLQQR